MHLRSSRPAKTAVVLLIVLGVFVLLALWVGSTYNSLVTQHGNVQTAWSHVEEQYQRRVDLIPNLVNTVKGSANFEQQTLTQVTEARTKWMNAGSADERIDAANQMEGALSRLLVTVEAYPQLKSTEAFITLMAQLEGTENRIGVARRDYNTRVGEYNIAVRRFPGNIAAMMLGFGQEKFFESAPGSEDAPTVDFGTTASVAAPASTSPSL